MDRKVVGELEILHIGKDVGVDDLQQVESDKRDNRVVAVTAEDVAVVERRLRRNRPGVLDVGRGGFVVDALVADVICPEEVCPALY